MRWGTKFGVIFVALTFVLMPFVNAGGYEGKKMYATATIVTPLGEETNTIELSEKKVREIENEVAKAEEAIKIITDPDADEDEKNIAMEIIEAFIEKLQELGLIPAGFPVMRILTNLMSPKIDILLPIVSFGRGFSWIPMYPGEAFIGFMFRPIIMQYFLFGYSGTINVNLLPPRIEYWDMVGTHTLFVCGFVGIYIDFGKIGYGIPKLQFLIGEALIAGGFDWF